MKHRRETLPGLLHWGGGIYFACLHVCGGRASTRFILAWLRHVQPAPSLPRSGGAVTSVLPRAAAPSLPRSGGAWSGEASEVLILLFLNKNCAECIYIFCGACMQANGQAEGAPPARPAEPPPPGVPFHHARGASRALNPQRRACSRYQTRREVARTQPESSDAAAHPNQK